MRRNRFGAIVCSALVLCLCASAAWAQESIRLQMGQEKTLNAANIVKVAVGDPGVANARDIGNGKLLITALSEGSTQILMWDEAGNETSVMVSVSAIDPDEIVDAIKPLIEDMVGVDILVAGSRVVLDGEVLTDADVARLDKITNGFPGVLNLVRLNMQPTAEVMANELEAKIGEEGVEVIVTEDNIILKGTVFDEATKERAAQLAASYVEDVVNLLQVDDSMVEIDIQFLQVNTRKARSYGVNIPQRLQFGFNFGYDGSWGKTKAWTDSKTQQRTWTGFQEQPTNTQWSWSNTFGKNIANGTTYGFTAALPTGNYLNWVLSNEIGKIISSPHLTTHNGKEAEFHAGGQTYFAIQGGVGGAGGLEEVEWGTILKIMPTYLDEDTIQCVIDIEVSAPTEPNFGENYALVKYQTTGEVKCDLGETVVVSGLLQEVLTRFADETPLLGKIPLLNLFFKSSSKDKSDQDLLILFTPYAPTVDELGEPSMGSGYAERKESSEQAN